MQISLKAPTGKTFDSRKLQCNLTPPTYYAGFCQLLNWWKSAAPPIVQRSAGGNLQGLAAINAGYLNSNGELPVPCASDVTVFGAYVIFNAGTIDGIDPFNGEAFTIKWDGRGCTLNAISGATIDNANGTATVTLAAGAALFAFWTITDRNDPPRNIRVYQTRYAANVAAGETFNPDWLKQVRGFKVLRVMDWLGTNWSPVTDISHFNQASSARWTGTYNDDWNGHAMPLSVIAELGNLTGCELHVCIPHQATNTCVTAMAAYFRDNLHTGRIIHFEYSNECWNSQFAQTSYCNTQGVALFASGNAFSDGRKWFGFRNAQIMKLVRDAFADRTRWRGAIGAWTVSTSTSDKIIEGINYWRTSTSSPLALTDLFDSLHITGYFGGVQGSRGITSITRANPGVVTTSANHDLATGQKVRFSFYNDHAGNSDGMEQLDGVEATVTVLSSTTFSIGINTSAYTALRATPLNAFCTDARLFLLMDQSEANHTANATTYPTNYTHFAQEMATAMQTGTSPSGLVADPGTTVAALISTHFPGHKTICDTNGLQLRQYEGGCHFVGDNYLTGYGGANSLGDRLTDYMKGSQHSAAFAAVYTASYVAFWNAGGLYPSKFSDMGQIIRSGGWGGMQYLPCAAAPSGDAGNPVWQAVLAANGFSIS